MNSSTIRLIALLTALVILVGINAATAIAAVPLPVAVVGNAIAALTAIIGVLAGDKGPSSSPPP
jgi:hypothetical protein